MLTQEKTSFDGKHYQIRDIEKAGDLPDGERPKIMVGGGGKKVLSVAGRHADIVGINMSVRSGNLGDAVRRQTREMVSRQVEWTRAAAEEHGRDPDEIELQMHVPWVKITDEPEQAYREVAESFGLTVEEARVCPKMLFGSSSEIRGRLRELRSDTGINYYSFGLNDAESIIEFSESVMKPLRE